MYLKRGLEKATKVIVDKIKEFSKEIKSSEEIAQIAALFLLITIQKSEL